MKIEDVLEAVKQNDNEAYSALLEMHNKMIYSIINDYDMEYGDYLVSKDDLYQEALIALYDAANSFDKKRDIKFSTYAYTVIKRRVYRFYKLYKKQYLISCYSIDEIEHVDYYKNFITHAVFEDPVEYHKRQEFNERIKVGSNTISDLDKNIILMKMDNYTYEEISKRLNITKKRVDNRLTRLRKTYLKNTQNSL